MMILRSSYRTDPRLVLGSATVRALPLGLHLGLPLGAALLASSLAASSIAGPQTRPQSAPSQPPASAPAPNPADVLKQRDQELDAVLARQRNSAEAQAKLRSEIEALSQDRRKFNAQLIETAARVRDVEAGINTTQTRLDTLNQQEALLRKSLERRQAVIVEIIAALQRVGRQPPALLVSPEDALRAVRAAITLGAVVPEMRVQADTLATDIAAL